MTEPRVVRPQPGFQEAFLSNPADIVIGGGTKDAGKTFGLLLEPLRHYRNPDFGAVIFRRDSTQIKAEGGLWDTSERIYPLVGDNGATPNMSALHWDFPNPRTGKTDGMRVKFSHLQHETDRFAWDGAQIPLLGFDQLESFLETQFWYLLTCSRSTCGVRPYVRASCNPVPEDDPTGGWLHKLISWWLDEETGLPRSDRAGLLRWFIRVSDELHWADDPETLRMRFPQIRAADLQPKSLAFVPGTLADNPILTEADPSYRATLMAMPYVERERLLGGNWKVKPTAGKVFNRAWFTNILAARPTDVTAWVRYWDKAGSEDRGKFTAGALVGRRRNGRYVIADMVRGQWSAGNRETIIQQTAAADRDQCGPELQVWLEQEPGSGGLESGQSSVRNLAGYLARLDRVTGDKVVRAGPLSAQAEIGNVDLVLGRTGPTGRSWVEEFLDEAQNFDGVHGYSDQIDAAAGAFAKVALATSTAELSFGSPNSAPKTAAEQDREEQERNARAARVVEEQIKRHGVYWPGVR